MGIFLTIENKIKEYGNGQTGESSICLLGDDSHDDYFAGNQFLMAAFSALNYSRSI
ncbi:hypothetical protein [Escherichia marmotae]|uniref:hypothetical protein n=1 Tax=Escherichia marmotae TaxID=1499973 RepID=UPI002F35188C